MRFSLLDARRTHAFEVPGTDTGRHLRAGRFEAIGASRIGTQSVEVAGADLLIPGAEVTASTFSMLAVAPVRGRLLRAEDEHPGGPDLVVISEAMSRSLGMAGGDLAGTTIRIGGVPHDVVGVMPEEFRFPSNQQLWLPMRERVGPVTIYGRLTDGVSPNDAQAELSAVHAALVVERPDIYNRLNPVVVHC